MVAGAQATSVGDGNLSLTLIGAQTWTNGSTSALTIGGNITNGANTLTLNATSAGAINVTGVIGNGGGGITVNSGAASAGIVTLSGNNTYSGTTTLTSGILRATTSANALGAGALSLGGGQLQLANTCLLYTSPSPRDGLLSRMPSSA